MVRMNNIAKSFGAKKVLDDVSIHISSRSTHVLLGSSGSGKSTLMRILLGVLAADAGSIEMNNVFFHPQQQSVWSRRIGYVPQGGGLFPHLTISQNAKLVAQTLRWPQSKINQRIDELLHVVSLEPGLLNRYPKELSGGQLQRVAILRAAFLDPLLLVLDEPLGALDPILRVDVQNELRDIFRKLGKTVFLVTHDMDEAQFFGDRFTLLRGGRVLQSGSFEDLEERPKDPFVSQFLHARRGSEE